VTYEEPDPSEMKASGGDVTDGDNEHIALLAHRYSKISKGSGIVK